MKTKITFLTTLILVLSFSFGFGQDWQPLGPDDIDYDGVALGQVSSKSMVLDSNGVPYIAFGDNVNSGNIKIRYLNNGKWQDFSTEGLPQVTSGAYLPKLSLAFDANDNLFIAFSDPGQGGKLSVARFLNNSWQMVGSAGLTTNPLTSDLQIKIAPSGDIFVTAQEFYYTGPWQNRTTFRNTILLQYADEQWNTLSSIETSSDTDSSTNNTILYSQRLALDGNGVPYLGLSYWNEVYECDGWNGCGSERYYYVKVQRLINNSWQTIYQTGAAKSGVQNIDIAIAPDNTPYMSYNYNGNNGAIFKYVNGSWLDNGNSYSNFPNTSNLKLAFGNNDELHVTYIDWSLQRKGSVKTLVNNQWTQLGNAAFSDYTAGSLTIDVASNNKIYVSYIQGEGNETAIVRTLVNSEWLEVNGSSGISDGTVNSLDLATAPDGMPFVVYDELTNTRKVRVKRYDGSSWLDVGEEGFLAYVNDVQIAIAPDGVPYVAYIDISNSYKATVQRYVDNAWEVVGNEGFSASRVAYLSLAISSNGTPYVAYQDRGNLDKLTVQSFNGTAWAAVGGTAGFSPDRVFYTTIAIAGDGTPYVAYSESAPLGISVQRFDGTAWEPVGGTSFSAGTASNIDMAISANGTPFVAYQDGGNDSRATVQRFNDTTWEPIGDVGFSSQLPYNLQIALTSEGRPVVVYRGQNSYKATVQYNDGNSWQYLGTDGFTAAQALYTKIAIGNQDEIIVAYALPESRVFAKTNQIELADDPLTHFVTSWKTDNLSTGSSDATSISIPTTGTGYNYDVDWDNDGVFDEFGIMGNATHDYGVAGTYTIRIRGDFPRIYFNRSGDKDKILTIEQWGDIAWSIYGIGICRLFKFRRYCY